MAGNSPPRRSSRARTGQSQSQHSSATSSLSGRPERTTRSLVKAASPQKSTPSLSDEPPEESVASTDEIPIRRRRTRATEQEQDRDKMPSARTTIEMAPDPDEIQEEDEAVRCICGFEEYPGLPPLEEDKKHTAATTTTTSASTTTTAAAATAAAAAATTITTTTTDSIDVDPLLPSDVNTDDLAGFYVQCDVCKVWQHGACVGIMSEEASPDEYFCEECRKDLHKIHMASNGQKYSHYLPLRSARQSTTRSRSPAGKDEKDARSTRSGRQSSLTQTQKRRSTMNSRDAAYDEEEQLRRAIEASKEYTFTETGEVSTRKAKRNRSDSEEKSDSTKKQRTKSRSSSPVEDDNDEEAIRDDSEEAPNSRTEPKKPRHGSARVQNNSKERSEKEERERQRAENAKRRSGRAERRRADGSTPVSTILAKGLEAQVDTDSDPSEELPLAARVAANRTSGEKAATAATETKAEVPTVPELPPSSQPTPDSPLPNVPAPATSKPKRSKKKGRNQYTKDREAREETSPARSQSRDVQGHDSGPSHHGKGGEGQSRSHGRTKGGFNSKVSMTDMKRKAHAMLDYISRTQVEMAGEVTPPNGESRRPSDNSAPLAAVGTTSTAEQRPKAVDGEAGSSTDAPKDFKDLSSMEMMDVLTRNLVKWQKEFAS